jgi:hypothetical protein
MPTRQQLHQVLDQVPDDQLFAALRFLEFLKADPVTLAILNAPLDDEPYTEEEQREDAEANAAFERGEGIPMEDIKREFGL